MSNPRNNVTLWVTLAADPQVRDLNNGSKVIDMRFALDYGKRDADNPDDRTAWINGTMFDNGDRDSKFVFDQISAGNLKKGSSVAITGELNIQAYTSKDGQKVEKTGVIISGLAYQRSGGAGEKKSNNDSGSDAPGEVIGKF